VVGVHDVRWILWPVALALDHHPLDRCVNHAQRSNLVDAPSISRISKIVAIVADIDRSSLQNIEALLVGKRRQLAEYEYKERRQHGSREDGSDESIEADPGRLCRGDL